jgi:hypothetical protein
MQAFEIKAIENRRFYAGLKSALGVGGRAFKSPRPDQLKTSPLFAMSGFWPD